MKIHKCLVRLAWREIRTLSIIGLLIFTLLPCLFMVIQKLVEPEVGDSLLGEGVNESLGWLFALLVGITLTCPDQKSQLRMFWMSRPIPILDFIWSKYLLGLWIVLFVPAATFVIDTFFLVIVYTNEINTGFLFHFLRMVICYPLVLCLLYSIAFMSGCLIGKAVESALVSLGFCMLVYFLPLFFPPLDWLSVISVALLRQSFNFATVIFALIMLAGCGLAFLVACLSIRKDLILPINKEAILFGLGFVIILIFTTGAYQYGSNLDCIQILSISDSQWKFTKMAVSENSVIIQKNTFSAESLVKKEVCRYNISSVTAGLISDPIDKIYVDVVSKNVRECNKIIIPTENTGVAYLIVNGTSQIAHKRCSDLCIIRIQDSSPMQVVNRFDLYPFFNNPLEGATFETISQAVNREIKKEFPVSKRESGYYTSVSIPFFSNWVCYDISSATEMPLMHYCPGKLIIRFGDELGFFNTSNPLAPTFEKTIPYSAKSFTTPDKEKPVIELPTIPDLSPKERFLVWRDFSIFGYLTSLEGDILAWTDLNRKKIFIYRVICYDEDKIHLEELCTLYRMFPEYILENTITKVTIHDGLLYAYANKGISVYDLQDPRNPRRVGHFRVPNENLSCIDFLSNGNVLLSGLGGNNIYVIAPPR